MKEIYLSLLSYKKFFSFSILRVATMVMTLIANVIIIRKLDVEEFGVFSIALLLVNLITTFGFSWSSSSILYFGSREREKYGNLNKTFWARNIIILISLIIVTVCIFIFRNQINEYVGLDIWFLLILWLYVSVLENYFIQYFLAVKKQLSSSMISISANAIYIFLILIFSFDVISLIIIYIVSRMSMIFYIWGINKNDIGKFEFDKEWFKEILNFSLWQLFGFSGIYLLNFGDIIVVKYFMTSEDVGIYNAAYQLFNATASFAYVISSYYAGSISIYFEKKKYEEIRQFFYKERIYIFIITVIVHLLVILLSKPIILTLYGKEYLQSVGIFNILMIGSMVKFLTVFYMLYYNTNGKYKIQQILNICVAIINVILSTIFIKLFGLNGPAIATVLTLFLSLAFSTWYCEKRIQRFLKEEIN